MDIVFLRELRLQAVIGVYEWERHQPQPLYMDLEMAFDTRPAAASDLLQDALDYHAVAQRLEAFVAGSEFHLLETLAQDCADLVMREFGVPWLRLTLNKPWAVLGARSVGIVIERGELP